VPHPVLNNVLISGTVSSKEKVALNKATSNLDWEIGKA
jgi:hypothetical protein